MRPEARPTTDRFDALIITQFLIEPMVLSVGGGLIGVVLGVMTPLLVSQLTAMKTVITWSRRPTGR